MRDDGRGGVYACVHMLLGWWESPKGIFTLAKSPRCLRMLSKVERSDEDRHTDTEE